MEILREVQALPTWCATDVQALLRRLADTLPSARIDWDVGAGEEWAQVLVAGEVECLIRAPTSVGQARRFAFLRSRPAGEGHLRPLLDACQVSVVELADFEDDSLSASSDDLAAFIGSAMPPEHVLDPRRFSANDLWFASV